jgi:hypothetical protein
MANPVVYTSFYSVWRASPFLPVSGEAGAFLGGLGLRFGGGFMKERNALYETITSAALKASFTAEKPIALRRL